MQPDDQGIFFVLIVQGGPGSGQFIYDVNGNLREAAVGQTGTDPVQGLTCPQGHSFWNGFGAIVLLISAANDAIFQYFDNASAVQGGLVLSGATAAGSDPVTATAYSAGQTITDIAFGDFLNSLGARIDFGIVAALTQNGRVTVAKGLAALNPSIQLFAPEQGQSGHLVMLMQGTSPDGTKPGQLLLASEPTGFTIPAPVTGALLEIQGDAAHTPALQVVTATAALAAFASIVSGDTTSRVSIDANGQISWGPGNAARDAFLGRQAANILQVTSADFDIATAGKGLRVKEGANAKMGTALLAGGTVVVANTSVTATSRIFLCCETPGGTPGFLRVSARTAGTSFTILSSSGTDTSTVGWIMFEPG